MLHLQTLGGLSIANARELQGAGGQRKSLVLLAVIAAAPNGGITREKLLGYFWPDATEERGKNALRQRLFALRRDLAEDELIVGTSELRLNPKVMTVDLWNFESALAAGDVERAAASYMGPFLDGVYLTDAPEVERWIEDMRSALAKRATVALTSIANAAAARGDHERAVATWRRLVSFDPTASAPTIGLLSALARSGDAPAALGHYRVYTTVLREGLDLPPDAAVTAVIEAIRKGQLASSPTRGVEAITGSFERSPGAGSVAPPASGDSERANEDRSTSRATSVPGFTATGATDAHARGARRRGLVGLVVATAAAATFFVLDRSPNARAALPRILVTDFRNETGDSLLNFLGGAAATSISGEVSRKGLASVLDSRLALSPEERGNSATAMLAAAERLGADKVVSGAFQLRGDSVFAEMSITDMKTGTMQQAVQPIGAPKDSADALLDRMKSKIAGTLESMQDPAFLLGGIEPPNEEALAEYTRAVEFAHQMEWRPATKHFLEAFRLDSSFVQAALGAMEDADSATIRTLLRAVGAKREQLQPLDRARYDYRVAYYDRDLERAYQIAGEMVKLAPTSRMALHARAMAAFNTRRYFEAAATFKRMNLPDKPPAPYIAFYGQVGMAFHQAGRFADQLRIVEIGMRENARDFDVCIDKAGALAALRRLEELTTLAPTCASRHEKGPAEGLMSFYDRAAVELLMHGQPQVADSFWNAAIAIAERERAANRISTEELAGQYYMAGRYENAALMVERVRRKPRINPIEIGAPLVVATHLKDTASVNWFRTLLDTMPGKNRPKLLSRARFAVAEGREEDALRLLEEFAEDGGLVVQQLYGQHVFAPLWKSPRWKALFTRR